MTPGGLTRWRLLPGIEHERCGRPLVVAAAILQEM